MIYILSKLVMYVLVSFLYIIFTYEQGNFHLIGNIYVKAREISVKEWNEVAKQPYKSSIDFCLQHNDSCYDDDIAKGVNWYDSIIFLNLMSKKDNLTPCYIIEENKIKFKINTCTGYRLPTEKEWNDMYNSGFAKTINILAKILPDKNGIFGLSNDVCEWTWDGETKEEFEINFSSKNFYKLEKNEPFISLKRVLKGCQNNSKEFYTSKDQNKEKLLGYIRHYNFPKTGLRPVRTKFK
jgi:formylglycine-generating enzyme required for sulfatase activity